MDFNYSINIKSLRQKFILINICIQKQVFNSGIFTLKDSIAPSVRLARTGAPSITISVVVDFAKSNLLL